MLLILFGLIRVFQVTQAAWVKNHQTLGVYLLLISNSIRCTDSLFFLFSGAVPAFKTGPSQAEVREPVLALTHIERFIFNYSCSLPKAKQMKQRVCSHPLDLLSPQDQRVSSVPASYFSTTRCPWIQPYLGRPYLGCPGANFIGIIRRNLRILFTQTSI